VGNLIQCCLYTGVDLRVIVEGTGDGLNSFCMFFIECRFGCFFDFLATNQEAILRYHASDMILVIETDAAYLVQPEAKSIIIS